MMCKDILNEGNPQIYAACGRGAISTLRIIRHGLSVLEIGNSPLPEPPTGVWTVKD
jgi:splicing factor 3B subunit 3